MFSRFTEDAQKILIMSKKEMQELKHPYVSSEHLLLSLLKNSKEISKIERRERHHVEQDAHAPPEQHAVDHKERHLRHQRLRAVPAHEIRLPAVGQVEDKRSRQVDDGKRKPHHDHQQRHQVAVRGRLALMFLRQVIIFHKALLMFQIQLATMTKTKVRNTALRCSRASI